MEDAVKGCLRQLLAKRRECEEWDLYKGLRARLTNFQKTMPLISVRTTPLLLQGDFGESARAVRRLLFVL